MNRQDAVKRLCMVLKRSIHVVICFSKPTECTTPRENPDVNYGLWVIMLRRRRFISCNECAALVGHVETGKGSAGVGAGSLW